MVQHILIINNWIKLVDDNSYSFWIEKITVGKNTLIWRSNKNVYWISIVLVVFPSTAVYSFTDTYAKKMPELIN